MGLICLWTQGHCARSRTRGSPCLHTNYTGIHSFGPRQLVVVQFDFATPWTAAPQASLSFAISQSLLKLMSIESVMPSNHLVLCRPLMLLPSIIPSIRIFSNELALHIRWPKYRSFSIGPSSDYSGLISFRID